MAAGDAGRRQGGRLCLDALVIRLGRPAPGEHTVTSRAVDVHGTVQPAITDPVIATKKTYWESNG
jgi:hypothetical protein